MAKWHQLIKIGKHTDRHGKEHDVTGDILDKVAANYDSQKGKAHIIVGHPNKSKVPSFGVIEAVKRIGDFLMFKPSDDVVPEFAALVRKGAFPDVSAGFESGFNGLNHVAFLSAEKPAVGGLKPIYEFSAPGNDEVPIISIDVTEALSKELPEFASSRDNWYTWRINSIGRLFRNFKNYLIDKEGQQKADEIMQEWELESLVQEPPQDEPQFSAATVTTDKNFEQEYNALLPKFEAASTQLAEFTTQAGTLSTENKQLKESNVSLQTRIIELETGARNAEFSSFVEKLIDEGRVLPDQKQTEIDQLELLHNATPPEFSSSNGEKSPVEKYKAALQVRPVIVPGCETKPPEFSSAETDPVKIGKQARAYIDEMGSKGVRVSEVDAVKHVTGR